MTNRKVMVTGFLILCLIAVMVTAGCMSQQGTTGDSALELFDRGQCGIQPGGSDGVVYVGSDDDNVYALDAATGTQLLEIHNRRQCEFQPGGSERRGICGER